MPGPVNAVAAVSPNDLWAVGYSRADYWDQPLVLHWDGLRWQTIYVPGGLGNPSNLSAIASVGPDDIWAVGGYMPPHLDHQTVTTVTLAEHWDGTQWSIVPSPSPGEENWLEAVAVAGPTDIWAVGYSRAKYWDQPLVLHWNGTNWQQIALPQLSGPRASGARLHAIAVSTPTDIWAVGTLNIDVDGFGGATLAMHWDGKTWAEVPSLGEGRLLAVASLSPRDVWAVGYDTNIRRHEAFYSKTLVGHWNGQWWSRVPSPTPVDGSCPYCDMYWSELHGIVVTSPKELWALGWSFSPGNANHPLILSWDGASWAIAAQPKVGYGYKSLNGVSLSAKGADLGLSDRGWYQPVLELPSNQGCDPMVATPRNPTTRVPRPEARDVIYFKTVGHTLRGGFRDHWQQHGGLAQFGYPITEEFQEGEYIVQYFERARLELQPGLASRLRVREALLASSALVSQWRSAPFQPPPPQLPPSPSYFPETLHTLAPQFAGYWQSHGGAAVYGYPISEPFTEANAADGQPYLVQYFPRQRLEYHPELPEPYRVSLGLLGVEFARQQGWLP